MAEDLVEDTGSVAEQHLLRDWRSVMFAPVGDGQRRRRGSDGVRLAAAVLALVCCVLVIRYDSRIDQAIVQVIHPPPRSITWLVTVVYQAGSIGVVIVLVGLALIARRWEIARDIALSAAGTAAVSGILVLLLGSHGGRPSGIVIDGYDLTFPGPADRSVHRGRHGGAALPGARRAAPHRDLHRPGGPGLGRGRSRAAAQRAGQPGHRLGSDRGGPAHLRVTSRPAFDR